MKSDWAVGTGTGRPGGADRAVARDADGLPYIPAKTLIGVWRDATETVAAALDGPSRHDWKEAVAFLFGDSPSRTGARPSTGAPRAAAIKARPARLPSEFAARLRGAGREGLRDALVFVKPGVRIDPANGRAANDQLRFLEVARRGLVLDSEVTIELGGVSEQAGERLLALALAGASYVERLGADRRRGSGRCHFALAGDTPAGWVRTQLAGDPPSLKPVQISCEPEPRVSTLTGDSLIVLSLDIDLQTPVLAAAGQIGNVVRSHDFIPGTHLLGIVVRAIDSIAGRGAAATAIRDGKLVVTDARPLIGGVRGRPVPFALSRAKGESGLEAGANVFNAFRDPDDALEGKQPREYRDGYLGAATGETLPSYAKVQTITRTHNTVDMETQRPTSAFGGLYSYEAIATGQRFGTEVRLVAQSAAIDIATLAERLSGPAALGRSKKDDYGAVVLSAQNQVAQPPEAQSLKEGDEFTVWLLSDLIATGENLRTDPSLGGLVASVRHALLRAGAPSELEIRAAEISDDRPRTAKLRTRRRDGWHAASGLPSETQVTIQAGSAAVLKVTAGSVPATALKQLTMLGAGDRRAEGFGELSVDDPLLISETREWTGAGRIEADRVAKPPPADATIAATTWPSELVGAARAVERAAWRAEIERRVLDLAADRDARRRALLGGASPPGASQLAALGNAVSTDPRAARMWLSDMRGVANRAQKWQPTAIEHLERMLTPGNQVWETIFPHGNGLPPSVGDDETEAKERLWDDALKFLVDACVRAERREAQRVAAAEAGT